MHDGIGQRKADHLKIIEEKAVDSSIPAGWDDYRFVHNALPELDFREIDVAVSVFGKRLAAPVLISSMTGGTEQALELNRRMASVAQALGLGMGVGSQRIALENESAITAFRVRDVAPDILLFANIGAVQLNYGVSPRDCAHLVEAIGADALFLHLNSIQEALQVDGNTDFRGLLGKIGQVCATVEVPVIVKEVGWGLSADVARRLCEVGVSGIDVAGAGGTSWSGVEQARATSPLLAMVAEAFSGWGIPTARAVPLVRAACPATMVVASGGIRTGIDAAKALALGADLCGLAAPVIRAAMLGPEEASTLLSVFVEQLRLAMFGIGAGTIPELQQTPSLERISY